MKNFDAAFKQQGDAFGTSPISFVVLTDRRNTAE
jgi:hypothetical protein